MQKVTTWPPTLPSSVDRRTIARPLRQHQSPMKQYKSGFVNCHCCCNRDVSSFVYLWFDCSSSSCLLIVISSLTERIQTHLITSNMNRRKIERCNSQPPFGYRIHNNQPLAVITVVRATSDDVDSFMSWCFGWWVYLYCLFSFVVVYHVF